MNTSNVTVIGWLVCLEGPDQGKDITLTKTQTGNGIGTDESMTVVIKDDENVAAENHALIQFDDRCGKCYIAPGFGKRIIRLNNEILFTSTYLKPYDRISIGKSEYAFIQYGGMIDPPNTFVKIKNKQPRVDLLTEMKDCVESPCVGWLINRGPAQETYKLSSDYNYIGKSETMDVVITSDDTIANENHAAIVYDPVNNMFSLVATNPNSGCYINGIPVNGIIPLKGFEEIALGQTRLFFVPFCGEFFKW